jgi:TolB-like protein
MTDAGARARLAEWVDLAREPDFTLGQARVRPSAYEVEVSGETIRLQPRVMQVLVALTRAEGAIVSRDLLVQSCWGGLAVGEDAINRCIQRLRRLSETGAPGAFRIETLPRIGYRLTSIERASPTESRPATDKPSIAVMPFANLSGDAEQDYFADGMVEEIAAALARFKSIFVIGSGSTLTFRGRAVSPPEVGRLLGVRYLLDGSVRKGGNHLRIAVKLTKAEDGAQVWAERFEGALDHVFALQDEVALAVAGAIEPAVLTAEITRAARKPTGSLSSYDLYLRALPLSRIPHRERLAEACALLERAIEHDPNFAPALTLLARCYGTLVTTGWSGEEDRRRGLELARQGVREAPDDAAVLATGGAAIVLLSSDWRDGAPFIERAVTLNPGDAFAHYYRAFLHLHRGEPEPAITECQTALRLDPLSDRRAVLGLYNGMARFQQGRFAAAAPLLKDATTEIGSPMSWSMLAATLGQLGDVENAARALARHREQAGDTVLVPTMLRGQPEHRKMFEDGIAVADGRAPASELTEGGR